MKICQNQESNLRTLGRQERSGGVFHAAVTRSNNIITACTEFVVRNGCGISRPPFRFRAISSEIAPSPEILGAVTPSGVPGWVQYPFYRTRQPPKHRPSYLLRTVTFGSYCSDSELSGTGTIIESGLSLPGNLSVLASLFHHLLQSTGPPPSPPHI